MNKYVGIGRNFEPIRVFPSSFFSCKVSCLPLLSFPLLALYLLDHCRTTRLKKIRPLDETMESIEDYYEHISKDQNWAEFGRFDGESFTTGLKKEESLGFEQIQRTEREIDHLKQLLKSRKLSRHKLVTQITLTDLD
jgi:hypothetical protein